MYIAVSNVNLKVVTYTVVVTQTTSFWALKADSNLPPTFPMAVIMIHRYWGFDYSSKVLRWTLHFSQSASTKQEGSGSSDGIMNGGA
ncbi:hypothetical protein ID866_1387 [Astraeus odoratus]|nr:hypothetical protein ID866_1387 [Astraeus odoratus]